MLRYCQQRAGEGRPYDASLNEMRARERMTTILMRQAVVESIETRYWRVAGDEAGAGMWRRCIVKQLERADDA